MDEPCLYPAIWRLGWELGAHLEARKIIILVGERRMGPPDQHVHSALENIQELERLEELMVRLHDVTSWCELLECPVPRRRKGQQLECMGWQWIEGDPDLPESTERTSSREAFALGYTLSCTTTS